MRHNNVVPLMALGVAQMKEDLGARYSDENFPEIHQFLDRFYMSRIGIRMLIGQHISLHTPKEHQKEDHIGLICTKLSPLEVAHAAIAGAPNPPDSDARAARGGDGRGEVGPRPGRRRGPAASGRPRQIRARGPLRSRTPSGGHLPPGPAAGG